MWRVRGLENAIISKHKSKLPRVKSASLRGTFEVTSHPELKFTFVPTRRSSAPVSMDSFKTGLPMA